MCQIIEIDHIEELEELIQDITVININYYLYFLIIHIKQLSIFTKNNITLLYDEKESIYRYMINYILNNVNLENYQLLLKSLISKYVNQSTIINLIINDLCKEIEILL